MTYPVRLDRITRYLSEVAIALAVLLGVPATFAAVTGEWPLALTALAVAATLGCLGEYGRRKLPTPSDVAPHEALSVVVLTFVLAALCGWGPFIAAGVPVWDALFEAISATTTTGLSTVVNIEEKSDAFKFARSWLQWIGGLNFAVLGLALAHTAGVANRHIASGQGETDDLVGNTRRHLQTILTIYAVLTIAGWLGLLASGTEPFSALLHTLSAVSTAGFAPSEESLGGIPAGPAWIVIAVMMIAGAISFTTYSHAWNQNWTHLRRDPHLHAFAAAMLVSFVLLFATSRLSSTSPDVSWSDAAMLTISAQTTTGFHSVPPAELDSASKLILIASMLIGGDAGSTAGGMKIVRFLVLLRVVQVLVARTAAPPHALTPTMLGGHKIMDGDAVAALAVVLLFILVPVVGCLPFLLHGYAPLDALFDVASAVSTTGLSTGIASSELETHLKLLLCFLMIAGRVELIAALVVLRPATWVESFKKENR